MDEMFDKMERRRGRAGPVLRRRRHDHDGGQPRPRHVACPPRAPTISSTRMCIPKGSAPQRGRRDVHQLHVRNAGGAGQRGVYLLFLAADAGAQPSADQTLAESDMMYPSADYLALCETMRGAARRDVNERHGARRGAMCAATTPAGKRLGVAR